MWFYQNDPLVSLFGPDGAELCHAEVTRYGFYTELRADNHAIHWLNQVGSRQMRISLTGQQSKAL